MSYYDKQFETANREEIENLQWVKLKSLLELVYRRNPFYQDKFKKHYISLSDIKELNDLEKLPFTSKQDFQKDQELNPIFGTNLSEPIENYIQYHQTTGTTGKPLKWLDTRESWLWRARCIAHVFKAAEITNHDILFLPFSFGPYTAFWGAYEAAQHLGVLTIPGGGWTTEQRLQSLLENKATVVVTTPTYALRMAEVASEEGIELTLSDVRVIILAGEPGATIPSVREKIEKSWRARVFDYPGLTEVGTYAFMCSEQPQALHVIESEFVVEVINPDTGRHVPEGEIGELVLTNLGRTASPAIRYRTGDLVKLTSVACQCGRIFRLLDGGVLGRKDEMLIIRGVNVFPSAIADVLEKFLEAGNEYQIVAYRKGDVDELEVQVELTPELNGLEKNIALELKKSLNLRISVRPVPLGTIERSDYKKKIFLDKRHNNVVNPN